MYPRRRWTLTMPRTALWGGGRARALRPASVRAPRVVFRLCAVLPRRVVTLLLFLLLSLWKSDGCWAVASRYDENRAAWFRLTVKS